MATRSTKTTPKAMTKAAPKKAVTKAAPVSAKAPAVQKPAPTTPAKATIVETITPTVAALPIKKPELIERVMAETGMKKKDVKPVVEAMLTVLGRTLSDGEDLTVPPLGKVMIKRVKDVANAKILTIKVRHPKGTTAPKDPMPHAAE